jgi:hypothetical protein
VYAQPDQSPGLCLIAGCCPPTCRFRYEELAEHFKVAHQRVQAIGLEAFFGGKVRACRS